MRYLCLCAIFVAAAARGQDYSAPKKPAASHIPAAKAQARCPWLTEGSAAAALGGEVVAVVSVAGASQGTCSFVRQDVPADHIRIVVGQGSIRSCPDGSKKVVGVGTHASRCQVSASASESTEMITGAVRETNVAIILGRNSHLEKSYSPVKRDFLEELAEQVAGNLF